MTTNGSESGKTLSERAMLVRLHVTGWSGRKQDQDVSADVALRAGADPVAKRVGAYSKRLLVGPVLDDVNRLAGVIRQVHYTLTMPWDDSGSRLLPVATYERYTQQMDQLIEQRQEARERFLTAYPEYVAEAKERLGTLYDQGDYPEVEDLRGKVTAEYHFTPLPRSSHFVVSSLMNDQVQDIRKSIEKQTEAKLHGTIISLWQRMAAGISAFAERMEPNEDGTHKVFRKSHLANLRELADLVPDLNIADDSSLNGLADNVKNLLDGVEADMLREHTEGYDSATRERVRTGFTDMSTAIAGYFPTVEAGNDDEEED